MLELELEAEALGLVLVEGELDGSAMATDPIPSPNPASPSVDTAAIVMRLFMSKVSFLVVDPQWGRSACSCHPKTPRACAGGVAGLCRRCESAPASGSQRGVGRSVCQAASRSERAR